MKNKLFSILITGFILCTNQVSYAQNLTTNYIITIWNKNFKGQEHIHKLETIGFLPVFQNNRDEITINNQTTVIENSLDIQVLNEDEKGIKLNLKYKDKDRSYTKQVVVQEKEVEDLQDFKIKVEKK